ncbi:MAG: acetate--CoA ligase [Campylobacterota bacterium]|nr:acetate--CoA ligase [Campylobacterota bacterium]
MKRDRIKKEQNSFSVKPNLVDYENEYKNFKWDDISYKFETPKNIGLNIAYEAIDRHAQSSLANKPALVFINKELNRKVYTYKHLQDQTSKAANVFNSLGLQKADRIFTLSSRIPELYISVLGALKNQNVVCPLFSQFGPQPILQRMSRGDASLLITTKKLYKKKIVPIIDQLKSLKYILLLDSDKDESENVLSFSTLMDKADDSFDIPYTDPEDMSLLHFTSGTTGMPKGVVHVHKAVYTHYVSGRYVLDLQKDDIYWCTADPGWVTGTSYGIITPWIHGVTNIIYEGEYDAAVWYKILQDEKITVWYTAPTAIRRLMRIDDSTLEGYNLSSLRLVQSVGEPLNPEAVVWGKEKLGLPIHDNWWQTETGGMMVANYISMDIKPGSMGKPLPGIEASIVQRDDKGKVREVTKANTEGDLAIKQGWPSMFRDYLHDKEKYEKCFVDGWYISGDLAYKDEDGYFWFVGRADDIIKTSGHMVGPFEVESALMEHPAVAEAGVIGKPDEMIGQLVKAFVTIKERYEPSEELNKELIGFCRKKLGAAVAPKEIEFEQNLPKTRSGKIMRRLLKAREMGLPQGDISTLED